MAARGRSFLANPGVVTGVMVGLVGTRIALFLFFQANQQTFSSPLDSLSYAMDAGRDAPYLVEQSETAQPAPQSITISTMLDRTAPIESYLREALMESDDAHPSASYIHHITAYR